MKVTWYRSATVGIHSNSGISVLCDPWINDGAFIGSWFHWPPIEGFENEELLSIKWDFLYISHFHADHFDRKFVSELAKRQPDMRVVLPEFSRKWLLRAVRNCGFDDSRVMELPSGTINWLGDINVTIFKADDCNPQICGSQSTCVPTTEFPEAIDSLALFEVDGNRILNANDALAVQSVNHLWKRIGRVDLLLGHFGGAGPFPQCFVDMDEESKLESAEKLANLFIQRLAIAAQTLRARYVMPYAGQYILGGRLTALNDFRAVVSLTDASSKLAEQTNSEIVTLSPFSAFHLDGDIQGSEWIEPNELERIKYIERIGNSKFPYESLNRPAGPIASLLESGAKRVLRLYENNSITNKKNHQSHSIVIGSPIEKITLNFGEISGQISTGNSPYYENCTYIEGDAWLMNNLLRRKSNYLGFTPYHFNQAEIGSHFEWKRSGSYSQVINFMNYFQAEDGL